MLLLFLKKQIPQNGITIACTYNVSVKQILMEAIETKELKVKLDNDEVIVIRVPEADISNKSHIMGK